MPETENSTTLTEAFLASRTALTRYIARFFACHEDIEDTIYEAYFKVFSSQKEIELQSPRAYLFRVARNIALNKKARQKKVFEQNIELFDDSIAVDDRATPYEKVYGQQTIQSFCNAIEALPPQCRKVFLMQRMEGMSYKEIARRLGISTRTVEKHLEKALRRCANHLIENGFVDSETDNVERIEKYRRRG